MAADNQISTKVHVIAILAAILDGTHTGQFERWEDAVEEAERLYSAAQHAVIYEDSNGPPIGD